MKAILSSRGCHHVARVGVFLIAAALIAAMVGCAPAPTRYNLAVGVAPGGAGTATDLTNASPYASGASVSIKAVAAAGYQFVGWSAPAGTFGNANAAQTTFTMPAQDVTVTANFEAIEQGVLFSDAFSDEAGVWGIGSFESGSAFYENGWLHLVAYTSGAGITLLASQNFTDFILEVETKLVEGTDVNLHEVICRYQDNAGYSCYAFDITAQGYYTIKRFIHGSATSLVELTQSSYINQGVDAVNLIRIECIGSNLSLSVNGHVLATVTDTTFSGGDIGLGADSEGASSTEVAFDNITVTEP